LYDWQFRLSEVSKTGGVVNLYHDIHDNDPMRAEKLFSKLECRAATILRKIKDAVLESQDHVDIFEKDVHVLFKFMYLSLLRSDWLRNEYRSPYRENNFLFQRRFDAAQSQGLLKDPEKIWLHELRFMLETPHEEILEKANTRDENQTAKSYKHLVDNFGLQIWKAADGLEFLLNDRFIDFEGDTEMSLGTQVKDNGLELIHITAEDWIHLVVPISPDVAVIFCNESRCWESPFADVMHQAKVPYPSNSLLKGAPHKDIKTSDVPKHKRGKKTWPATTKWEVHIGKLSDKQHGILTSYCLSHARSFIVSKRRSRFEKARKESEKFGEERAAEWKRNGIRVQSSESRSATARPDFHGTGVQHVAQERIDRLADDQIEAYCEIIDMIRSQQPIPKTKESWVKCWLAFQFLGAVGQKDRLSEVETIEDPSRLSQFTNPGVLLAFEASYPPKPEGHQDLLNIDFEIFFTEALGEESFAQIFREVDKKLGEVVHKDNFSDYFEAGRICFSESSPQNPDPEVSTVEKDANDILESPSFEEAYRAAITFEVIGWMFKQRQDILVTFVHKISVPAETLHPRVTRTRARRE
jgi:hypothetical protein